MRLQPPLYFHLRFKAHDAHAGSVTMRFLADDDMASYSSVTCRFTMQGRSPAEADAFAGHTGQAFSMGQLRSIRGCRAYPSPAHAGENITLHLRVTTLQRPRDCQHFVITRAGALDKQAAASLSFVIFASAILPSCRVEFSARRCRQVYRP